MRDARESSGPTWEPTTYTHTQRLGAATAALVALTPAALVPLTAVTCPPTTAMPPAPHVVAYQPDDRREVAALRRAARSQTRANPPVRGAAPVVPTRSGTAGTPPAPPHPPHPAGRPESAHAPRGGAGAVVAFALAQVGHRYVWGAAGPGAYDCSGLAAAAFARVGVYLPHTTTGMLTHGHSVSRAQLRPGDLVFTDGGGHVQIYIGGGWIVEAANPRVGVVARPMWGFWAARRIL